MVDGRAPERGASTDPWRNAVRRSSILVPSLVVALVAVACGDSSSDSSGASDTVPSDAAAAGTGGDETVPFEEASLIIETNATDGDAGLQIFLDHDAWKSLSLALPDGTTILDITNQAALEDFGLTELFSESSEPPFTEFPLEEFKELWPEGEYTVTGETINGVKLESSVTLTHNIPEGPEILAPEEDTTVPANGLVVRWEPVTEPEDIEIVAYQVIVETDQGPLRVLDVKLPASATQLSVPTEFLRPGGYKVEVLAIERGGNQTLTEVPFEAG
jgi:hypothetical protein